MMEDGEIVEAVAMDEDLQLLKNGKSAYDLLRDSKASVEEIVSQIVSMKKDGKDKSKLRELVTQTFLHFVTLRQYPDIELVPEEEFFRDAPEDIKSSVLSNDGSQNLMLKRLNYELHQRKELCKLREKLESQKKSLLETIANRKKFLSSASANVETLRVDDDVPEDEDDVQRRRKRPKRAPSKENPDQAGLHQVHPLKLILHIYNDEASDPKSAKLISLKFEYLLKLHVVCVGIEGSHEGAENNILCNLFPNDTGAELPHQNRVQTVVQRIRCRKMAQLALVKQLDSLVQLKWPSVNCERVPWASHTPLCSLDSWSSIAPPPNQASSLHAIPTDQVEEHMDIDRDGRSGTSKEGLEGVREDGELPSLVQRGSMADDMKHTTSKVSNVERSRQLALISKSVISPLSKVKSHSFKKYDEDTELLLDIDSDNDELTQNEQETEDVDSTQGHLFSSESWVDFGAKEYSLILTRKLSSEGRNVKLEAKIKIGMEYPLRPPLFSLSICTSEGSQDEADSYKWFNELRAIEAEVNLNILEIVPNDEENSIVAHQILCLAMLFDHLIDEEASPSEKSTHVVDVGLSKPVFGTILARSHRGRDRRRMISWKGV
ncbi:THO complex subunit 5B [Linum perenne]